MEQDYVGESWDDLLPHIDDDLRMEAICEHVTEDCQCEGKKCSACENVKCHGAFGVYKTGLKSQCKPCRSLAERAYKQAHPERVQAQKAAYREKNREKLRLAAKVYNDQHVDDHKQYYQLHKDRIRERDRRDRDRVRVNRRAWYYRHRQERALYNYRYRQEHHERLRIQKKVDYVANATKYRSRAATRRLINPDYDRIWALTHREQRRVYVRTHSRGWKARRRTLLTQAGGFYTVAEWEALKAKYNYTCLCCGRQEPEIKLTADHVIPVTKLGSSNIDNIQPLCKSCNSQKHNKIIDYRRSDDAI